MNQADTIVGFVDFLPSFPRTSHKAFIKVTLSYAESRHALSKFPELARGDRHGLAYHNISAKCFSRCKSMLAFYVKPPHMLKAGYTQRIQGIH